MATHKIAAVGGWTFTGLYIVHRILQGFGPGGDVAKYNVDHRGTLLVSEIAVGLALLAFIPFAAALSTLIREAGQPVLATAVAISSTVFIAMGFLSTAAETALVNVADSGQPGAVLVLDQLQGRTPVVWTIAALVAVVSLAIRRTGLLWPWLAWGGFVAAVVFLLGSVFSVLGREVEGSSSLFGIGLFIVWMLTVSSGLWRRRVDPVH
jgi:hypothetical protein